jgi:hypothetical protein
MGHWGYVKPEALSNLLGNPSFEYDTEGWSDLAGGTITSVQPPVGAANGVYGEKVASVAITAANDGAYYQDIELSSGEPYYVRAMVGTYAGGTDATTQMNLKLSVIRTDTSTEVAAGDIDMPNLVETDGDFSEIVFAFVAPASTDYRIQIETTTYSAVEWASFLYFLVDGVMVVELDFLENVVTEAGSNLLSTSVEITYIDGDQPGCEWVAEPHNSISRTSMSGVNSRVAGQIIDLFDDYEFYVSGDGVGMAQMKWDIDTNPFPYSGDTVVAMRVPARRFKITGVLKGDSYSDLRQKRNQLIADLGADSLPYIEETPSPLTLMYFGSEKTLAINCNLVGGLQQPARNVKAFVERLDLDFEAVRDPFWKELGYTTVELSGEESQTIYGVQARIDGEWSAVGITSLSGGTSVNTVAWGPDGKLYFGGNFTQVNSVSDTAYIARYNPATEEIEAVETTTALNAEVNTIFFTPDKRMYVGGEFDNAGIEYFVYLLDTRWGGAGTWQNPTGGTLDDAVEDITLDESNGHVIAVGSFTTDGTTTLNRILDYDPSAGTYSAFGTGVDDTASSVAYLRDGNDTILVGGSFLNAGGSAATYLAAYQDGSWISAATLNTSVASVRAYKDGAIVSGAFGTVDGEDAGGGLIYVQAITSDYFGWRTLGEIPGTAPYYQKALIDGNRIYLNIGGESGESDAKEMGLWNGAAWVYLDTSAYGQRDCDINNKGELACAPTSGSVEVSGSTTVTLRRGAARTYPVLTIYRSGGSELHLQNLANERTEERIYFDIDVLDEETIVVDCQTLQIRSSLDRPLSVEPGSEPMGLIQGDNPITLFCLGDATVKFALTYRPRYWSYDAGEDSE